MSQPITCEKALKLFGALQINTSIEGISPEVIEWILQNPKIAGERLSSFLKRGIVSPFELKYNFDFKEFGIPGWSIFSQTSQPSSLPNLDKVMLRFEKNCATGQERNQCLQEDSTGFALGVNFFLMLWRNKDLIPDRWKYLSVHGRNFWFVFDGTVFADREGKRHLLCMYFEDGVWKYEFVLLNACLGPHIRSVVWVPNS